MRRLLWPLTESSGRIAAAYLLFGVVWIVATDTVVRNVAATPAAVTRLQTVKGWLFVVASAAVIFGLIRARERRLSAEQEFTDLALDSLRDVFVVLDRDGDIERVNRTAVEVSGYSEAELLGMDTIDAFSFEDRAKVETAIDEAFDGRQAPVRATVVTKDGARVEFEFRGRRMVDADDDLLGLVVIGRDVTDRVFNEQRLDVALRVLRHNLRNDLNVIRGWAEALGDETDPVTVREKITDRVDRLLSTSEKTRRMAELGGPSDAPRRTVDVTDLVSSLVEEFRAAHPEATVEMELPEETGTVVTSGYQLETAVRNAVENALDHNTADSPWVRVAVRPSDGRTAIVVEDDGPGIPAGERTVFEEGHETQLEHGSGVGLWMVHWCLHDLGGSVRLLDREPTGTEVRLEFPASGA